MATVLQKITWWILRYTATGANVRKLNLSCSMQQPEPEAPLLFFANHAHLSDPFLAGFFMKNPVSYVGNSDGITIAQRIGSSLVGVIPKKKGQPDLESLKMTIQSIKAGHSVGIFPEGDRCWDGETNSIFESTGSLVKKLGVPVMLGRFSGNYLSCPRWADYPRRGRMFLDIQVIEAEQIKEMSRAEINETISRAIYNNDIKNERLKEFEFRGKDLAAGVQHLLWLCPECGSADSITGAGDTIRCSCCSAEWKLDGHLGITPSSSIGIDLKDWSDWQKERIKEIIAENKQPLTESRNVRIGKRFGKKLIYEASGDLLLHRDRVVFQPADDGDETVFPLNDVKYYIDNFNRSFEFSFHNDRIALDFQGANSSKWQFFIEELQA